MIKFIARLEHKIGERLYHLHCDHDAPVSELKEALCQFLAHVTQIESNAKATVTAQASAAIQEPLAEDKVVPIEKAE